MVAELTTILKDEEKTLRTKYLIYDAITLSETDPIVLNCINQSLKNFISEPSDISVRITMVIK